MDNNYQPDIYNPGKEFYAVGPMDNQVKLQKPSQWSQREKKILFISISMVIAIALASIMVCKRMSSMASFLERTGSAEAQMLIEAYTEFMAMKEEMESSKDSPEKREEVEECLNFLRDVIDNTKNHIRASIRRGDILFAETEKLEEEKTELQKKSEKISSEKESSSITSLIAAKNAEIRKKNEERERIAEKNAPLLEKFYEKMLKVRNGENENEQNIFFKRPAYTELDRKDVVQPDRKDVAQPDRKDVVQPDRKDVVQPDHKDVVQPDHK